MCLCLLLGLRKISRLKASGSLTMLVNALWGSSRWNPISATLTDYSWCLLFRSWTECWSSGLGGYYMGRVDCSFPFLAFRCQRGRVRTVRFLSAGYLLGESQARFFIWFTYACDLEYLSLYLMLCLNYVLCVVVLFGPFYCNMFETMLLWLSKWLSLRLCWTILIYGYYWLSIIVKTIWHGMISISKT